MNKLVLIRHGQSLWNMENRFTGWTDIDLSDKGTEEARNAGKILKNNGYEFDVAFTSVLKRAIRTLWIVLEEMDLVWIPVYKSWKLNERHYGALQGLNKDETIEKYGTEQVHKWRRYVHIKPPAIESGDERNPIFSPQYKNLRHDEIPLTENLVDTQVRVLNYWNEKVVPCIKEGKKVLISAHGNTIRALIKYLDDVPDNGIVNLNIPTGTPIVYELNDDLKPIRHYYLCLEGEVPQGEIPVNIPEGK